MADILHDLPIKAPARRVFEAVSTPAGLDQWWAERSGGTPAPDATYDLGFGPDYQWRARVTRFTPDTDFELELIAADDDWIGTRVGFHLEPRGDRTWLRFSHTGWPSTNEHYRISCNCWALYLRVLRRFLEHGETVPYEQRLDV
jgi:uncharacterized protein YndB with AHSA1/START domain